MNNLLLTATGVILNPLNITLIIIWSVIVIGCIVSEIITSNFITIWFSLGAFIALILLACDQEWFIQLPVFAGVSCICLCLFYPILRKYVLRKKVLLTNVSALIGQTARVEQIYVDNPGVKDGVAILNDSRWIFVKVNPQEVLEIGDIVRILKVVGTRIHVKK